jgi:hypothetical protein
MRRSASHRCSPGTARSCVCRREVVRCTRSRVRSCLAAVGVGLFLLGAIPSSAPADADPASDVLLAQNAFFPYQPPVAPQLETALNRSLEAAVRVGMPLKVAIIGSPEDLGAIPEFFGHPQSYASFLDREISFNHAQPLLVVMAAGYGLAAAGPASALAAHPVDASHASYGLTRSAILAVSALARARGHPISLPAIPSSSTAHESVSVTLLFAIPAALLVCAGLFLLRGDGSGKRRAPEPPPPFQRPPA